MYIGGRKDSHRKSGAKKRSRQWDQNATTEPHQVTAGTVVPLMGWVGV